MNVSEIAGMIAELHVGIVDAESARSEAGCLLNILNGLRGWGCAGSRGARGRCRSVCGPGARHRRSSGNAAP